MSTKQITEPGRLLTKVGANRPFAVGRAMAFIEEKVKDLMHRVNPLGELARLGWLEHNVMFDQVAGGALETLLDCFLADEEGAGDFRVAEAAQGLERQGQLVFSRQMEMAAGEHHSELAVLDFRVEKQIVQTFFIRRPVGGPLPQDALTDLVTTQGIQNLVLGDAVNPPRRIIGHSANAPRLQGVH
jgi:hypothetical protein